MPLTRSHTILFSAPFSRSVQVDPSETDMDRERRNNVFRVAQELCDRRDAGVSTADINMPSIIERHIHRIPEDRVLEEATYMPTPYQMAAECMHERHVTITMANEDWANMVARKMRACGLGMNCPLITWLIKERKQPVKIFTRKLRLAAYLLDPVKPEEMMLAVATILPTEDVATDTGCQLAESIIMPDGTTVPIVEDYDDRWEAHGLKRVKHKVAALLGRLKMKMSRGKDRGGEGGEAGGIRSS